MNSPNFLCIGAHRAGTTWLQKALESHPDVFLPMKEIHFFDRDPGYPSPDFLAESRPIYRLLKKENRQRHIQIVRALAKSGLTLNRDRFRFFSRFFSPIDDRWYPQLFKTKRSYRIKGDITPAYSILNRPDVGRIREVNPKMKIVFILRNPIYREWSACRYNVSRYRHRVDSIAYFDSDDMALRSDYLRTLDNYAACFPADQMLNCFFDELAHDPVRFYERICRFLEIVPEKTVAFAQKYNQSPDRDFDPEIKAYLAARHLPQLEKLADRFEGYCRRWHEEALEIVEKNGLSQQRRHPNVETGTDD